MLNAFRHLRILNQVSCFCLVARLPCAQRLPAFKDIEFFREFRQSFQFVLNAFRHLRILNLIFFDPRANIANQVLNAFRHLRILNLIFFDPRANIANQVLNAFRHLRILNQNQSRDIFFDNLSAQRLPAFKDIESGKRRSSPRWRMCSTPSGI